MKSFNEQFLCCNYRLFKVGLLVGFVYLMPNLIIVGQVFRDDCIYKLLIMCAVTFMSSVLLVKGLQDENHHLLLPWMKNIGVLIIFNIILFMFQFHEFSRSENKTLFYLQFGFFISLELQIILWYVIYCLLLRFYQKSELLSGQINTVSQIVDHHTSDYFRVNLIANDHLMGGKIVHNV